jgi:hypothetical protein
MSARERNVCSAAASRRLPPVSSMERLAHRELHRPRGAGGLPGSGRTGASRGGRACVPRDAGPGRCARGQGQSSPPRPASPDRAVRVAARGGRAPQGRCVSRSGVSGCPGAGCDRRPDGGLAPRGAPRAVTHWPPPPLRRSPREVRRSRCCSWSNCHDRAEKKEPGREFAKSHDQAPEGRAEGA